MVKKATEASQPPQVAKPRDGVDSLAEKLESLSGLLDWTQQSMHSDSDDDAMDLARAAARLVLEGAETRLRGLSYPGATDFERGVSIGQEKALAYVRAIDLGGGKP